MSKQILSALMFGHNRVRTLDEQPSLPFTLPDCGNTHWNRSPPTNGKRDIEENGCEPFGLCDAYMVHRPDVCGPSRRTRVSCKKGSPLASEVCSGSSIVTRQQD